jgi:hypothetical protein
VGDTIIRPAWLLASGLYLFIGILEWRAVANPSTSAVASLLPPILAGYLPEVCYLRDLEGIATNAGKARFVSVRHVFADTVSAFVRIGLHHSSLSPQRQAQQAPETFS